MSKYAFTSYQKVLLDLRTVLRGGSFNKDDFVKEVNILDDTIVDFSPLVTKFENNTLNNLYPVSRGFPSELPIKTAS